MINDYATILPPVAALELTYSCNHSCIFCSCPWEVSPDYKESELSFTEWSLVIDKLMEFGVSAFTLTGGEPLLRPDLKDIIDYIISHGASVNLISNGRKIDDDFLSYIASRGISISISIPGIETFPEHTGVDNVEHVLSLFERTRSLGIKTTANIAVTKKNLPELYENIAYALIKGADYILLNRFLPGGRGLNNIEYLLSVDEVNLMLDIAETVLAKANRFGHVGTELPLCAIRDPGKYKHLQVSTMCSAAKGFCVVDPSGYLKVCNHSPIRVCKYTEIEQLQNSTYWSQFRARDYLPETCKDCNSLDKCDGGCREAAHVFFGDVKAQDPLLINPVTPLWP